MDSQPWDSCNEQIQKPQNADLILSKEHENTGRFLSPTRPYIIAANTPTCSAVSNFKSNSRANSKAEPFSFSCSSTFQLNTNASGPHQIGIPIRALMVSICVAGLVNTQQELDINEKENSSKNSPQLASNKATNFLMDLTKAMCQQSDIIWPRSYLNFLSKSRK